jgi:hypothetical protein
MVRVDHRTKLHVAGTCGSLVITTKLQHGRHFLSLHSPKITLITAVYFTKICYHISCWDLRQGDTSVLADSKFGARAFHYY